jgi:hypothetical protein
MRRNISREMPLSRNTVRATLVVMAGLALPQALGAQQTHAITARVPGSDAAAPSREEARAAMAELQSITARLQTAHNRAMEDAGMRGTQQALARDIKAAMELADPELPELADRVRRMEEEARGAQERGDVGRVQTLTREFALIRQRFMRAQTQALQTPDLAQRARAFDEQLHRRMLAAEPQTDQLLARSRELQERLRGAVTGRSRPAAPRRTP